MAGEDSPDKTYFYADEDVFIGRKRTQREIIKSTLMGQNYLSPVVKSSASSTSNLPDIISVSSDQNSAVLNENVDSNDSSCFTFSNQKDDDVIIIDSDSHNGSVQIISDDDSNDESLALCRSTVKQNTHNCNTDDVSDNIYLEPEDVTKETANKEMAVGTSECVKEEQDEGENISEQESNRLENWKTLLDVIPDLKTNSKENEALGSSSLSIDALIEASRKVEAPNVADVDTCKPTLDSSTFSNLDFSLLTGVNSSILDISHGSSLPSPAVAQHDSSLGLLPTPVYEDISCDGDRMFDTCEKPPKTTEVDLHMSVDETDYMIHGLEQNIETGSNVTQPTLYKSCMSECSNSVYITANNTEYVSALKQPSSSFSNYRDTFDDSVLAEGMDSIHCMDLSNDNMKNEASFEIVMNNRQNSFTNTVLKETKTENTAENPKPLSKLPVLSSASSILKPPSLQSKVDDKLKAKNFKWAKTLPKPYFTESKNTVSTNKTSTKTSNGKLLSSEQGKKPLANSVSIHKPTPIKTPANQTSNGRLLSSEQEKKQIANSHSIRKPTIKTPAKSVLGKTTSNDSMIPCKTRLNEPTPKSTSFSKTPDRRTPSQLPKLLKSDAKTPKEVKPTTNLLSSGKRNENKNLLIDKERYKNVISPVRAYINNAPIHIQRIVHVPEEQIVLMGGSAKKAESHIPKPVSTPRSGSRVKTTGIPVKSSKVAQKLFYNKAQNQENMDPNYTRDTLPPRMFQAAAAVFIKEPEPPKKHLPKIGESMQKLIDTPRPKVTVHQGRVRESPRAKGVLIPAINFIPSTPETSELQAAGDSRISIRVVKPADGSDN